MNDTPTLAQIHHALETRIRNAQRSKLALGETIRDCCLKRPNDVPFEIGGHQLKWVEAECEVHGGRNFDLEMGHTQIVLLLNGRLIDEPKVEATYPDWTENGWDALWSGPTNGWYHSGAWEAYENDGSNPDHKPHPMKTCKLAELKEVARALPAVMAPWLAQKMSDLESEKADTDAANDSLRPPAANN